jgi:hypothetical protein
VRVVISQPMYFPWVGMLEQIRLAEVFVRYDDVQFARGFYNRVQVKTANGTPWITVPTKDYHRGQKLNEMRIDDSRNWRKQHLEMLRQAYSAAPYYEEMLEIVNSVFAQRASTLSEISQFSIMALTKYFDLEVGRQFINSSRLGIDGSSSQRLHDITLKVGGDIYVTGHGAKNYLDHDLFERSGIGVEYLDYQCLPYPQLHGQFTPYVSALDLVANCGKHGKVYISSNTVSWRNFIS